MKRQEQTVRLERPQGATSSIGTKLFIDGLQVRRLRSVDVMESHEAGGVPTVTVTFEMTGANLEIADVIPDAERTSVERLYQEVSEKYGHIRFERWPEGLVLWVGGGILWKSWGAPGPNVIPGLSQEYAGPKV